MNPPSNPSSEYASRVGTPKLDQLIDAFQRTDADLVDAITSGSDDRIKGLSDRVENGVEALLAYQPTGHADAVRFTKFLLETFILRDCLSLETRQRHVTKILEVISLLGASSVDNA